MHTLGKRICWYLKIRVSKRIFLFKKGAHFQRRKNSLLGVYHCIWISSWINFLKVKSSELFHDVQRQGQKIGLQSHMTLLCEEKNEIMKKHNPPQQKQIMVYYNPHITG